MKTKTGAPAPGPKRFFDVMRPGKATPPATSRPVIVGHKPKVNDISGITSRDERPAEDRTLMDGKSRITVQPAGALNSAPPAASPGSNPVNPPREGVFEPETAGPEADLGGLAISTETEALLLADNPSPAAAPGPTGPGRPDAVIEAAAKDLESSTLADGTIIVSHHKGGFRLGRFLAVALLVIVAAAIVLDVLLDLKVVNLKNIPHTNFLG